ncbi:polyisoprenoid-binding protein YceI [Janthinobacterium sp. CG_23.3]|uniref:YceI family protein n=1 Tax=unclassified Janthinobacterium TaxID=2610881 RepID=UPI00036A679E|nr:MULTISPECIES: YceI family protein [unclassified Janthinobacterium]MEC5162471.1 polyisoprenoid-binding protein YceI [Janthinobacterium sp. CG_S6]
MKLQHLVVALLAAGATSAFAADTYNIDPTHTYPSFEADHMGLSVWRGKFGKTKGTVTLDRAAKNGGALDITIDAASIDFGFDKMTSHAKSPDMFNVEKYPDVSYKSTALKFNGDKLVSVDGELTMLGVTKPVTLSVNKFRCIMHPRLKREVCGADASAEFKRTDFGLNYGTPAFAPEVKLAIQVEAIKAD